MTTANKITIARILSIPVFVLFAIYYGQSVKRGMPDENLRYSAIAIFLLASLSDGLDGYIARHYNQRSRLGAVLDPLADKGLLLTAIITLSLSNWTIEFPIWFPILIIARDSVILVGAGLLHYLNGKLDVRPSLLGKLSTLLQMVAIGWVMLQLPRHTIPVALAGVVTLVSGIGYVVQTIRTLHEQGHGNPGT